MSGTLRDQWRAFAAQPCGRRFQMRYRQHREKRTGLTRKIIFMSLGVVLMLVGTVMLVLPGPGLLVMIAGAALFAEESKFTALALDRVDLWITRQVMRWRARRAARRP
ncbi:MAG: PGPGW domain-containing protein [Dokdonella sp.]